VIILNIGMACALNLLEPTHYLLMRGADLEKAHGPYKKTALHVAVEQGNILMVKFLLKNGANIEAKDIFGFDIYEKAEYRGYYDFKRVFDYFKDNDDNNLKGTIDYEKLKQIYNSNKDKKNLILDDFKPSDMLELTVVNDIKLEKNLNKVDEARFDLEKFSINFYNEYKI
jgi:ankyrin repeat protein